MCAGVSVSVSVCIGKPWLNEKKKCSIVGRYIVSLSTSMRCHFCHGKKFFFFLIFISRKKYSRKKARKKILLFCSGKNIFGRGWRKITWLKVKGVRENYYYPLTILLVVMVVVSTMSTQTGKRWNKKAVFVQIKYWKKSTKKIFRKFFFFFFEKISLPHWNTSIRLCCCCFFNFVWECFSTKKVLRKIFLVQTAGFAFQTHQG